jgi:hypothetical protein
MSHIIDFISGLFSHRYLLFRIPIFLLCGAYIIQLVTKKKREKLKEDEDTMLSQQYEKDENGLYPWESDTDDSPDRIPDDARRYSNRKTGGPKRGRWR